MKFGKIRTVEAQGAILAHSLRQGDINFRKGRPLSPGDIAALGKSGIEEVIAARLEAGDLAENEAASRIAQGAAGDHIRADEPFTGRANLFAEADGVLVFSPDAIHRANRVDEAITIATLPPFGRVKPGQMLATIKIIPFAAPARAVDEVVALMGPDRLMLSPFSPHRAGLVLTTLPGLAEKVLEKTGQVVRDRLTSAGSQLETTLIVPHESKAVAAAIETLNANGCDPILLFGASAITGREDVLPDGLEAAGGTVVHLGMPVDPGNLLMLGRLGEAHVIGLPGCARSPKLNGFDWVLERLLADIDITKEDITGMGVGGLLKDSPARFSPRQSRKEASEKPNITAVLLAAGQSRRMGADNKLLSLITGKPMVRHAAETILASPIDELIVVTGMDEASLLNALEGLVFSHVHNPDFAAGLSTSLKAGLAALSDDCDGFLVCLGDMPGVSAAHIKRLANAFAPEKGASICVPTFNGKHGNPVLWDIKFRSDMTVLAGDVGARHLIGLNADQVREVAMVDDAVLTDLDTPDALALYREKELP